MACNTQQIKQPDSWCNQKPRAQFSSLKEVHTSHPWFKVYNVGKGVLAIAEPYNYQEVISYLITGKDKALLFDTGMGLDTISAVVKELTSLPVTVINSHTHYDHIGGNAEFDSIIAMNTPFTITNAQHGWWHDVVKEEITPQAICLDKLPGFDTAAYHIRPFKISQLVTDGYIINLGGRELKIIAVPGHTPDAIALLDSANGYLFTGDTFYEGPIFLFTEETDVKAYRKSITKLALLEPNLTLLFPSHNTPVAQPKQLDSLWDAFEKIMDGKIKGVDAEATQAYGFAKGAEFFDFNSFSFLIRKDQLK